MTGATMTLAFELAALRQAREPQAVVVDARRWAQHVGLTTTDHDAAGALSAEHLVRRAFQVRPTVENFRGLCSRFPTQRHVLIGDGPDRPDSLPDDQWEYLGLDDAAGAAGWEVWDDEPRSRDPWASRLVRALGTRR